MGDDPPPQHEFESMNKYYPHHEGNAQCFKHIFNSFGEFHLLHLICEKNYLSQIGLKTKVL